MATSCKRLDNLSHVMPGWGCCQCCAYNGYQRSQCRMCGHDHCYPFTLGEVLTIAGSTDLYDPGTRTVVKAAKA